MFCEFFSNFEQTFGVASLRNSRSISPNLSVVCVGTLFTAATREKNHLGVVISKYDQNVVFRKIDLKSECRWRHL